MYRSLVVCMVWLFSAVAAAAQGEFASAPVVSTLVVRTGEPLQSPHRLTYRLVEFSQQRGRWILPDLGAYDSSAGKDKLLFTGAGAEFRIGRRIDYTQIVYFAQDVGPGSHAARMLWVWPVLDVDLGRRWMAEGVAYPTIPLNRAAQTGFDIDRIKLERELTRRFSAGAGYSASLCTGKPWDNKPFVTTTVRSRAGSFEFWLERIDAGAQVQVRYTLIHAAR